MIKKLAYYRSTSYSPYHNLALEESFLENMQEDEALLYLWQNERTVVIGKNQSARREVAEDLLERDGGHLARRLTGGGAVYHDLGNLNFTFIVPSADYDVERQNGIICKALNSFGLYPTISGRNDMLLEGKKFSGHAYLRKQKFSLHHGTLLVNSDIAMMERYLVVSEDKREAHNVESVSARVINLSEINNEITIDSLALAIKNAFRGEYGLPLLKKEEPQDLRSSFFADSKWLYTRESFGKKEKAKRFSWGSIILAYKEVSGTMADVVVYTDAMHEDLAQEIMRVLEGQDEKHLDLSAINDPYRSDLGGWLNG